MDYIKINQTGAFGKDYIDDINEPGKYLIPIPNYDFDDEEDSEPYEWIGVTVTRVVKPPLARFMVIIGYDENNESQAWYYNGSQNCFKRVFQGGPVGGEPEYKNKEGFEYFFIEDADCKNGRELVKYFMSL